MKTEKKASFCVCFLCTFLWASISFATSIDSLKQSFLQSKTDSAKVKLLNSISTRYRDAGKFDSAIVFSDSALRMAVRIDYKKGVALSQNNSGIANYYLGNYKNALENYFASNRNYEQLASATKESYNKEYADTYNNIAMVYQALNKNEEALQYHEKALSIRERIGNKNELSDSYNNIGIVYSQTGNFKLADENYKKALALKLELKQQKGIARAYNNIGSNILNHGLKLQEAGDNAQTNTYFKQALENFTTALEIEEKIEDVRSIAMSYANIGGSYYCLKNYPASEIWFAKGLNISKTIRDKYLLRGIYSGLSDLSFKMGNFKDAFFNLQQADLYKDSILNEETARNITEIQTKYETENKNKQIRLLEKEKQIQALEISKQQEQAKKNKVLLNSGVVIFILLVVLSWAVYSRYRIKEKTKQLQQYAEIEMKALRAQMNPHFIFNSLASIQQFIYSQKPDVANDYLTRFSKLIRMIFDHSSETNISLADDLEALKLYMDLEQLRLDGKFVYNFQIEPDVDLEGIEIPPLIIQPYVENAIWHGISQLEGTGKIDILIKISNIGKSNILTCTVKDNGIGRSLSEKNKRHKNTSHKSRGMSITSERLELLNSIQGNKNSVEIIDLYSENKEPIGTEVHIFMPLKS